MKKKSKIKKLLFTLFFGFLAFEMGSMILIAFKIL